MLTDEWRDAVENFDGMKDLFRHTHVYPVIDEEADLAAFLKGWPAKEPNDV